MTSKLIRRSLRAYESSPEDLAITLRLDRTEPPIPYRQAISDCNSSSNTWSRYPSTHPLEAKLARRFRVQPENVILTAGADEALDRACRAALSNDDHMLTTTPMFEMIEKYADLAGATISEVPWLDNEFPLDELAMSISPQTRLIILVSPNNPTGRCIPLEQLRKIAMDNPDTLLVADLAYVEFAESDPTRDLLPFPNVVMVRSFSKAWGLPGLRLGYALGNAEVIQAMRAAGGPYSVAATSIKTLDSNFERFEHDMLAYVERIKLERGMLEAWLLASGVSFVSSQSNFILLFPSDTDCFDRALRSFGIQARAFSTNKYS